MLILIFGTFGNRTCCDRIIRAGKIPGEPKKGVRLMLRYEQWMEAVGILQTQIEEFFNLTQYLDQEQVLIPDLVPTAETLYAQEQLDRFCHELEEAYYQVKRLNADVEVSGKLRRGENGRFWLENEELAAGRSVELYYKDDFSLNNIEYWHAGHIDHNGNKYYFTGNRTLELEGVPARIKKRL